ncbi:MAG TPA: xanthine dehydrogenase family protein molybdopterin-binding subunit [bacterium]|nr:xanthine dehydrogenase family protein molybdopterin-binding subunit [bacterium]HMY34757.1 xanthine dehydrogenase family protein molybdopterin-binding subunit [bacterium]HMZ03377.1 xanthine dehydrogenase family protein molybdopterin-binding subunit [bacterium]HNB07985.1 xanthine dehydrogenase family protein molybdopterin-binding subunit [bacterium]HNB55408.1 xanthine dehydrogenase family protein molybdopterin-binding subunit [bacterium]
MIKPNPKKNQFSIIGKPNPKIEGLEKANGSALYTDDLMLPNMLIGKILRSPHPHALIKKIDTSKAEALPGVKAVMIGTELTEKYGVLPASQDETVLAVDKVCYIGDGVAAVAALDEETAEKACELIEVEYEVLKPCLTIEDGFREDLPKIHPHTKQANVMKEVHQEFGDVEEGFKEADLVMENEYFFEGNTHLPLEPHCALAQYGSDGKLTIWSSTQTPHYLHVALAKVLQMKRSHIRVIKPHIGAGYGGKSEPFALEFCAAWLSKKTGRPVKFLYTREEVFYAHRGRQPMKMILKTGVKKDGSITAIHMRTFLDGGSFGSYGLVTTYYSGVFLTLPYKVPRYKFDAYRIYTNKPAGGPKRGHGAVQPRFAMECQLDKIAEKLGLDPVEMRLKNSIEPNTMTINSFRVTSCGIKECLTSTRSRSEFDKKYASYKKQNSKVIRKGIGIAASTYISGAGKSIIWNDMPHSGVQIKVDRGGGVTVFCGASDIGQGSDSMLAYITAEVLGVEISDVHVCQTDTHLTPVDLGSYSSRVTFMAGNACIQAAERIKEMIFEIASRKLGVPVTDLDNGKRLIFSKSDPNKFMDFVEAANMAESAYGTIGATGSYKPPKIGGSYKGAGAGPSPSYTFSTHIAEVSVDVETGAVTVEKIWSAHDCGRALNPVIVEGQIEGSVYMGVGEALFEEHIFHKNGLHRNPSILEYKVPTILDTPEIESIIVESIDPEGPFGAKEAGEGPLHAAIPAIANAIYNAIGVRLDTTPFTPDKILKALEEKELAEKGGNGHSKKLRDIGAKKLVSHIATT